MAVGPPWEPPEPTALLPLQVPPDQRDPRLPQLPPPLGEARLRLSARGLGRHGRGRSQLPRAVPGGGVPGLPARPRSLPSLPCTGTDCNKAFLRDTAPSASSTELRPPLASRPAPSLPVPSPSSPHPAPSLPAPRWRRRHHSAGLGQARDAPAAPRPAGRFGTARAAEAAIGLAAAAVGAGQGARKPRAARPARSAAPAPRRRESAVRNLPLRTRRAEPVERWRRCGMSRR